MRILIVDDAQIWLGQGRRLLESAGYEVDTYLVENPRAVVGVKLPDDLREKLGAVDVLLSDKDIGQGFTTDRLLCVIRSRFPDLPVIRWTGGYERARTTWFLRVSELSKPTKGQKEKEFIEKFEEALDEQWLVLAGPMVVFEQVEVWVEGKDEYAAKDRELRLRQLSQIVGLAEEDRVPDLDENGFQERAYNGGLRYWSVLGRDAGVTMHEFGHAICDGRLTADDIRPFLPALQKVVEKLESFGTIDDRFRICADFITQGDLDELELVCHCY